MNICLAMIVKNESHCIKRCLESALPYIHRFAIVDTGSTDNTQDIILQTLNKIPGQIISEPWQDFSTNRNQSIALAKQQGCDYILMLDADDYLQFTNPNCLSNLHQDIYDVQFNHAGIKYRRPQLWKSSLEAQYVGVLHEYLSTPEGSSKVNLEGVSIMFGANGSRSRDSQKYLKDCQVFEQELEKNSNNERSVFYLAQSYRDAGLHDKAILSYFKRFKMNGWVEEKYVAILEAAKLYEKLNPSDHQTVELMYLQAYQTLPSRPEALHYLSLYFRNRKDFVKAYSYAKVGCAEKHQSEGLFLETACQWKLHDELSIAAYWIGKKDECKKICQELLRNQNVPEYEKERIIKNLSFC